jgi:Tol biopolymer transport system component
LSRIPATGGKAEPLTRLDTTLNELTHRWPSFLPDQDHFLFFARSSLAGFGGDDRDHLYVGSLSQGTTKRLLPAVSDAQYANGMLLYIRESSIVGQAFDPERMELRGDPVTIAQNVQYTPRWSRGSFSVAPNGMLCYLPGGQESRPEISIVRKDGSLVHRMGRLDLMFRSSLSPDGSRVVMDLLDAQSRNIDIWVYDIARGMKTRLTFSKDPDLAPIWSPDGNAVAYASGMGRETRLVIQPVTGSGEERTIVQAADAFPNDWSPDNRYILYSLRGGKSDLWVAPLDGTGPPVALTSTEHNELLGRFSPDMRWIAYMSDESGRNEIYVRSFSPPGREDHHAVVKRQISSDGGGGPRWTPDGRGITYLTPRGIMLAELKDTGSMLEVLRVSPYSSVQATSFNDVLPGAGLMITQSFQPGSGVIPLRLVVNWPADLAARP